VVAGTRAKLTAATYSPWSTVWTAYSANPPSIPTLSSPAANVLVGSSPLFNWNNSTVPAGVTFDHYQIVVATDSAFTSIAYTADVAGLANSQDNGAVLDPGKTYFWRVRAFNAAGDYSLWSLVRSVKTQFSAPTLVSPGADVPNPAPNAHTRRPTYQWNAIPGASGYTLEVSTSAAFTTKIINKSVTGVTSYTHTADLAANTPYFWRVKANGTYGPSAYSSPLKTFVTGNPPSIPNQVAPASNALVTSLTPLLDWSNSTAPAGAPGFHQYEVQIASDAAFSTLVSTLTSVGITNSQITSPTLLNGVTYFWRVRSENVGVDGIGGNTDDDFSGWSTSRSLRVPFAGPPLTLPLDTATGVTLKPTFQWVAVAGATNYTLQVSTSNTFSSLVLNKTVNGTTYAQTTNLSGGTTYFWRVRVNGPYGPGAWNVFSFITQ
jgi:large repetitive protein